MVQLNPEVHIKIINQTINLLSQIVSETSPHPEDSNRVERKAEGEASESIITIDRSLNASLSDDDLDPGCTLSEKIQAFTDKYYENAPQECQNILYKSKALQFIFDQRENRIKEGDFDIRVFEKSHFDFAANALTVINKEFDKGDDKDIDLLRKNLNEMISDYKEKQKKSKNDPNL